MKVAVTMSKEEKKKVLDQVLFDPCEHIECRNIDCVNCPLREAAVKLRDAIDDFDRVIKEIPTEGE